MCINLILEIAKIHIIYQEKIYELLRFFVVSLITHFKVLFGKFGAIVLCRIKGLITPKSLNVTRIKTNKPICTVLTCINLHPNYQNFAKLPIPIKINY